MKHLVIIHILFLSFVFQEIQAQTYSIGQTTITFNDPSRSGGFGSGGGPGRQIQTEIYYPANSNGTNVALASGTFPVVVFGHGFAMAWDAYENVWEDLASKGYIIAFPRTEGSLIPAPDHNDFGLDLALVEVQMQALNSNSGSIFFQKVINKSAIMGHSMGGGATFIGAANNSSTSLVTVIGLAPAETNPSAISAALNVNLDALILSGGSDAVTPPNDNHLPIYQNLNSSCKTFISITNGSHCYFANTNTNCDLGELFSGTGSLPRGQQQDISSDYVNLWLAYKLKDDCSAFDYFQDSLSISNRITSIQSCNVTPVSSIMIDTSICFGSNYVLNNMTYSSSGNYFDTITNALGCDSILYEINLTVFSLDSSYSSSFSCNPMDTGSFQTIFQNQFLCDSIYSSRVDLAPFALATVNLASCDSIEVLGRFYSQNTSFNDTITGGSNNGCDSITIFNILINNSSSQVLEISICEGDSFLLPDGNYADTSGSFTYNLTNNSNCDSTLTLELTLIDSLVISNSDFEVISESNDTIVYFYNPSYTYDSLIWQDGNSILLESNGNTAIYYTGNTVAIFGFNSLVFNASCAQSFEYSSSVGIKDRMDVSFSLYPNPASSFVQIKADAKITYLEIINNIGQIKYQITCNQQSYLLDTQTWSNGIYFIKTNFGTQKIVVYTNYFQ